jgi:hypothetical protein
MQTGLGIRLSLWDTKVLAKLLNVVQATRTLKWETMWFFNFPRLVGDVAAV